MAVIVAGVLELQYQSGPFYVTSWTPFRRTITRGLSGHGRHGRWLICVYRSIPILARCSYIDRDESSSSAPNRSSTLALRRRRFHRDEHTTHNEQGKPKSTTPTQFLYNEYSCIA